jgi:hypothetical protein
MSAGKTALVVGGVGVAGLVAFLAMRHFSAPKTATTTPAAAAAAAKPPAGGGSNVATIASAGISALPGVITAIGNLFNNDDDDT